MATALGGTAIIGPQARPIQRPARVLGNVANTAKLAVSAKAVVASAVPRVRVMAVARPGVASASRIGCHDSWLPPSTGKYPAAGRITPIQLAASGRTRSPRSTASATWCQLPARMPVLAAAAVTLTPSGFDGGHP